MDDINKKNKKSLSDILLIITFILCVLFILYGAIDPKVITYGSVILLSLLILLALSPRFDKLTVGKFLSVSRKLETVESKQDGIAEEQKALRKEILSIVSQQISFTQSFAQNQKAIASPVTNINIQDRSSEEEKGIEKEISKDDKEKFEVALKNGIKKPWYDISGKFDSIIKKKNLEAFGIRINRYRKYSFELRSLNFSDLHLNQVVTVSGDLARDPLLSIMHTSFDGLMFTTIKDIFFNVIYLDMTNDSLFNLVFKNLSILQRYQETKNKNYTLILIVVFGETLKITNNRAESMRKFLQKNFDSFISTGVLEFQTLSFAEVQMIADEKLKSKKNTASDDKNDQEGKIQS